MDEKEIKCHLAFHWNSAASVNQSLQIQTIMFVYSLLPTAHVAGQPDGACCTHSESGMWFADAGLSQYMFIIT